MASLRAPTALTHSLCFPRATWHSAAASVSSMAQPVRVSAAWPVRVLPGALRAPMPHVVHHSHPSLPASIHSFPAPQRLMFVACTSRAHDFSCRSSFRFPPLRSSMPSPAVAPALPASVCAALQWRHWPLSSPSSNNSPPPPSPPIPFPPFPLASQRLPVLRASASPDPSPAPVEPEATHSPIPVPPPGWAEQQQQEAEATAEERDGVTIRRRPPGGAAAHMVGPFQFRVGGKVEENVPRNILEEIVWHKDGEVAAFKERTPLSALARALEGAPPARDFVGALRAREAETGLPALIAEVKKASPSRGVIQPDFDPVRPRPPPPRSRPPSLHPPLLPRAAIHWPDLALFVFACAAARIALAPPCTVRIAKAYEQGGAACLSVLTDSKFFQGSFENLELIRAAGVECPLLCKEFVVDAWQVYCARTKAADAVLLIAAVLPDQDLRYLMKITRSLGMAALIEVHTEREMDRVLALEGVTLIGINNRDLGTFKVDIGNTQQLLAGERGAAIRERGIMVVGESGLFTPDDVAFVQKAGCNAVLVGESLVRTSDPTAAIAALFGRPITTAPGQPDPTQARAPA
ncbi:unnamed protein product [Closterium sp. Naga37s-1]|nr:unnamed protein product [Closterium sp. Naga37s-1]